MKILDIIAEKALNDVRDWNTERIIILLSSIGVTGMWPCSVVAIDQLTKDSIEVLLTLPKFRFHLQLTYKVKDKIELEDVSLVPYREVYLLITSNVLSYQEVSEMIDCTPSDGWSIGSKFRDTNRTMSFTSVKFRVKSTRYETISKDIEKVFEKTRLTKSRINNLAGKAVCKIIVAVWSHHSTYQGFIISNKASRLLAETSVSLDYMPYVFGDVSVSTQ